MSVYKILEQENGSQVIYKSENNLVIDEVPGNRDYEDYVKWLISGNAPVFTSYIQNRLDTLESDLRVVKDSISLLELSK